MAMATIYSITGKKMAMLATRGMSNITKGVKLGKMFFKTTKKGYEIRQDNDAAKYNIPVNQEGPSNGPGMAERWVGQIFHRQPLLRCIHLAPQ